MPNPVTSNTPICSRDFLFQRDSVARSGQVHLFFALLFEVPDHRHLHPAGVPFPLPKPQNDTDQHEEAHEGANDYRHELAFGQSFGTLLADASHRY